MKKQITVKRLKLYSWLVIVITLAISGWFTWELAGNARMETDLDEYMPKDHPAFVYSDMAEDWFNIKDGILIAIENPEGIYNAGTLDKIKDITKALQDMEAIEDADVTSLYTADNIVGSEYGLDVKAFYKRTPKSEEKLKELRELVIANEMVQGRIVSDDETVALVVASIADSVFSMQFYEDILAFADSYEGPENIYVAGVPIVEGTMAYLGPKDMKKMVPIVIVVIILVLYLVLRSIRHTISTLAVVLISTIWAFGLMAVLGISIYAVTIMIPVMLIAIGVADGIHLYSHLHLFLDEQPNATVKEALGDMIRNMWKPVVMTSVTTAVGFISLLTSEVLPIKYFGLFTAFGVLMAMILSLVFIPAFGFAFGISRKKKKQQSKTEKHSFTERLANNFALATIRHKVLVISTTVILLVVSIFGIQKVYINSSFLENFERDSDIVLTDAFVNKHFGGTSSINVILESEDKDAMIRPEVEKLIDEMQTEVETLALVGNSFSISDYIRRMNQVMHADDPAFDVIPDSQEMIAQYLLLYEMSGDPENLWKVVDYDYRKANVTVQLKSDNSKDLNQTIEILEKYRAPFSELNVEMNFAGSGYKALVFTGLILNGQIKSLLMSIVIIIILLALMFRKVSIGFIGAIPVVLTAAISFGVMGLLNISLSTTTALVSSIAIGIGIDYAVHFIERYKIYALQTKDKSLTIGETMHHSGRAIAFNAFVVIMGFLVLLFSVFPPNRSLGALVSFNMFISFIATVTIMYLVLYKSNVFFNKKKTKEK
ncbi:MAG: efflux RND transporter permease subunit [Bacteroidetes bacterium]|jgi:predicted RND superfamily exporter protein|nr:efflux RND transporter permease subunit [Bacteroidota bacterium]